MVQVVWTEPAFNDLEPNGDYIAIETPVAAAALVQKVFGDVGHLEAHPESGSRPSELKRSRYRQIVEPPCRVSYRYDGKKVIVLIVMRSEQLLRRTSSLPVSERAEIHACAVRVELAPPRIIVAESAAVGLCIAQKAGKLSSRPVSTAARE
jgi:plasmid stabilization system protein ParE